MKLALLLALFTLATLLLVEDSQALPNRPCRFQVRQSDGSWSKLVGRRGQQKAVAEGNEWRRAPFRKRFVPRFINCLSKRYGVSSTKARAVAWCESRYERFAVSPAGHKGIYQMTAGWGTTRQRFNPWWSARRALLYVKNNSWAPWSCS